MIIDSDTEKYDKMKYDRMKVMQYNINDINIYEVRCDDMLSVRTYIYHIKLKLPTGTI